MPPTAHHTLFRQNLCFLKLVLKDCNHPGLICSKRCATALTVCPEDAGPEPPESRVSYSLKVGDLGLDAQTWGLGMGSLQNVKCCAWLPPVPCFA